MLFRLILMVLRVVCCGKIPVEYIAGRMSEMTGYEEDLPFRDKCQCVPANLCLDNEIENDGEGLLDVRLQKNECPNYFEVCCQNPKSDLQDNPVPEEIPAECGYQANSPIIPRITKDSNQTEFGELPWTLIILTNFPYLNGKSIYKCGGSLVHPKVAMTAAHCVAGIEAEYLIVRGGEWNTHSLDEPTAHQDLEVEEVVIHPHFHIGSLRNDIALLFLKDIFSLTVNIGIVCLPQEDLPIPSANTKCTASGWGKEAFKQGKHSTVMKKVDLPLVDREDCVSALRETRLGGNYNLHQSFICAGGEYNKDTCKGDGGSPLVCPMGTDHRFYQVGIVSWGIGCGENNTPGVYVNVALFTNWIEGEFSTRELYLIIYQS